MTVQKPRSKAARPEGQPAYATPALDKGLDIIELLSGQTSGLTKSQLAQQLNRSVSEIFRMLVCLEERGYIACGAEDRYTLTLKLFRLVQEHRPTERLLAEALPVMRGLAHETQQSCHLGVLDVGRVVVLAQVNSPSPIGFYVKLGSTMELMHAGSGYVILAHLGAEDQERTLLQWGYLAKRKPPADLIDHLARIRKRGFEKKASYLVKGVVDISFPIWGEWGVVVGALTVPYIKYAEATASEADVIEGVRLAAAVISKKIAGQASA